jgi:hypothetical protein
MYFRTLRIIVFLLCSTLAHAQEWGLVISPAISKGKLPRGVAVGHAGAPFFAGNLIVEEKDQPGFAFEVFRETGTKFKYISYKAAVGYLTCGAFQHYDYDYENSIGNIVSTENRFRYITASALVKYNVSIKKITAFASIGPHVGYMIYATYNSKRFVNGDIVQSGDISTLPRENRVNYGTQLTMGARYKSFSIEPFYRSFYKATSYSDQRRVVNYGVALSFYIWNQ